MWKYMYIHAYTYWHRISGMAGERVLMVVDDDEQVWEVCWMRRDKRSVPVWAKRS